VKNDFWPAAIGAITVSMLFVLTQASGWLTRNRDRERQQLDGALESARRCQEGLLAVTDAIVDDPNSFFAQRVAWSRLARIEKPELTSVVPGISNLLNFAHERLLDVEYDFLADEGRITKSRILEILPDCAYVVKSLVDFRETHKDALDLDHSARHDAGEASGRYWRL